ncbi:hypothetical protein A9A59_0770 [Tepidiforma thermophila]|uniref:Uncharacterized protein n=2 Tax=Tepidiforma thermophila (strain KCTC 52669 / CGMCC 1.13589 / G233) TaxID=2761530 RepID=A0A2A9HEP0_TEPT2|nr:hypothetical protein A9A59_0770 [Tepidiforma thermophila]
MMRGMAGKAPLLLAAFLFGIGASGLFILSFADRAAWGPFRPAVQLSPPQRVIVIDVGAPATPPALEGLLTGQPGGASEALAAEPAPELPAGGDAGAAGQPSSTPTPLPPIRIHGVAADDGVSAAGATPTTPPVRVINVAAGEGE